MCSNQGGAIYANFYVISSLTISSTNFSNCIISESSSTPSGNAIYGTVIMSPITMNNCNFIDCGKQGSVIYTRSDTYIYDTNIEFSSKEENCNGLFYDYSPKVDIQRC